MTDIYRGVGRLRHRRVPDRHRQARQHRVLAEVRPGDRGRGRGRRQRRLLHVRRGLRRQPGVHVAVHDRGRPAGDARLRLPGPGQRLRRRAARPSSCATCSPTTTTTPTPTRTRTRCRRSSATTTWAGSASSSPTAAARRRRAARPRPARPLADVPHPRPAGRLLRRRAGLHRRRRRQGRPPGHVRRRRSTTYNDDDLIGTDATTADDNFDTDHPLYQHLADLSALRAEHPALADGAQIHRYASGNAGVYAFSRIDADDEREYVVALNNSETDADGHVRHVQRARQVPRPVAGRHRRRPQRREGRVTVTVPPLSVPSCGAPQSRPRRASGTRRRCSSARRDPGAPSAGGPRSVSPCRTTGSTR